MGLLTLASSAGSALADIGHLFESVGRPDQQVEGALTLLGRWVPYDRCALLDTSGATARHRIFPASAAEAGELGERLEGLFQRLSDPASLPGVPLATSAPVPGLAQLAFPVVALDEPIGILLVERRRGEYEEDHLQFLAVVAAQIGAYLANVRLQSEAAQAAQATRRASELLDRLRDGYLELDGSATCVRANSAASDLLGVPHARLVGAPVDAISELGGSEAFLSAWATVRAERVLSRVAAQYLPARGLWLEFELYPTEHGAAVFLRDVSERHAAEELRDLLTGIVGHDLRTPVSAITMTAEVLLKNGGLDARMERSLERIASSGARMSEMVTHLLDVTRIQLGNGIPIEKQPADLARVCRDVVDELAASRPGRMITCQLEGDLSGEWDTARLAQVLSNLLANAVQYGDPAAPVLLSAQVEAGGYVRLEVHNEGAPIPAESLATLFQPFRQASREAKGGGLGLGLYIAQSIARAHGGTLTADSSAERGTTFTLRLPARGGAKLPPARSTSPRDA